VTEAGLVIIGTRDAANLAGLWARQLTDGFRLHAGRARRVPPRPIPIGSQASVDVIVSQPADPQVDHATSIDYLR
jgi:hypothetical protein